MNRRTEAGELLEMKCCERAQKSLPILSRKGWWEKHISFSSLEFFFLKNRQICDYVSSLFCCIFMKKCQIIKQNSPEPSWLNVIPDKVKFQEEVWLGWLITFQEVPAPYEIQSQIPVCPVSSSVRIQSIERAFSYLGKPPFLLALWLYQVKDRVYFRIILSKKSNFTLFSVNLSHILKVFK